MKKYQLVSLLCLISIVYGQNLVDLRTQSKDVNFSSAASTIPARSGTALPATCNVGEMFFNTANTPGQNVYSCDPVNTWTLIQGTGSGTVSSASVGQFGYYAANGTVITGHALSASDIPALNYQTPLMFTGNGSKTTSSAGTLINNDCAKWDPNGNIIDSGAPCATVATGSSGQFAFYSANGTALSAHTLMATDIPALSYQAPLSFTGNGTRTPSSTGSLTSNDCAKWDVNGNIVDAGGPCGTVAGGSTGQFAFYSANGSALTPHSLTAADIPALSYQALLSFTGNGAKTASSTGSLTLNDCAKWDVNGNIVDAGSPCGTVASGSAGQFAFYSANGSALTAHSLTAADIPALSYQAPLVFSGNTSRVASSTGNTTSSDCAKWDANGNIIDAGSPCGTVATGTTGQFAVYSANGSALTSHTLTASDIPPLGYQPALSFTGNGSKAVTFTGSFTTGDCLKWDVNGNAIDAGAPCGSGSGGGGITAPSSTTVGNIPQFNNTTGTALSAGLGVVTTVGTPGLDTNVPTEKSVRTAIAAASAAAGNLPAQTGTAGYLFTNGTSASWGNIVTGGSGALDCATIPGVCDIVTSVVPLKASANLMTGVNKFSQLQVNIYTVATLPACNSSFEGQMEGVSDAVTPTYLATVSGGGSVHVPVYCNGTNWVAH